MGGVSVIVLAANSAPITAELIGFHPNNQRRCNQRPLLTQQVSPAPVFISVIAEATSPHQCSSVLSSAGESPCCAALAAGGSDWRRRPMCLRSEINTAQHLQPPGYSEPAGAE